MMVDNIVASSSSQNPPRKIKLATFVLVDALAKSSSTSRTAWPELLRKTPVCSKATIVRNLPVLGTNVVSAFGAPMSSLVMAVIGHDVGKVRLVKVLMAVLIMVLKHFPLLTDIFSQVRASEHCVQHCQVGEQHGAVHERLRRVTIHWWGM